MGRAARKETNWPTLFFLLPLTLPHSLSRPAPISTQGNPILPSCLLPSSSSPELLLFTADPLGIDLVARRKSRPAYVVICTLPHTGACNRFNEFRADLLEILCSRRPAEGRTSDVMARITRLTWPDDLSTLKLRRTPPPLSINNIG